MSTCNGCEFRPELHYDADYQIWVRVEGDGTVSVGMTDISQTKAGRIMPRANRPNPRQANIQSVPVPTIIQP